MSARVVAVLLVLCGLRSLAAQGASADDLAQRLADLERQRKEFTRLLQLEKQKNWTEAARALARLAAARHPVPLPWSKGAPDRGALLARAATLRLRFEQARKRKLARAGKATPPQAVLDELDAFVRADYQGADLGKVWKKVLKSSSDLQLAGLAPDYGWGQRLRRQLPRFPCAFERLKGNTKRAVKEEWAAASMSARRDFLKAAVIEARTYVQAIRFLDLPGRVSLSNATEAVAVAPQILQVAPEDHAGRWVILDGTFTQRAGSGDREPLPFGVRLELEEVDPRLLQILAYRPADQECLMDLTRLKLATHPARWARAYPARSLGKKLAALAKGSAVLLTGRVLERPGSSPGFVLEVWRVERAR